MVAAYASRTFFANGCSTLPVARNFPRLVDQPAETTMTMTMTGLHVSAELSRTPVSRTSRRGLVGIPPAVQEIALRRVIARNEEFGDPLPAEVTGILLIVVASVMENQLTPGAVVDARAQTDIGRRLIEVIW